MSQLDSAGQSACSSFAAAKGESDNGTGIEEIRQGLLSAQQSSTAGLSSDLVASVEGFTAKAKAERLLEVCDRYGF